MIKLFVVDASVALGWVHPARATAETAAWLALIAAQADLVVPAIWPLEVSNALLVLERRKKLSARERARAVDLLRELPATVDTESLGRAFSGLAELAGREELSVYDASYLELAMRRGVPLACRDGPLRAAAARNGLRVDP